MKRRHRIHLTTSALAAALALLSSSPSLAQDQKSLRMAFEGKRVILKIDMPATNSGVDVWPGRDMPVKFPDVAKLIKANGIAIRAGEEQMVTKVHLVRNHIEFQLGGGGYGTFADLVSSPYQAPALSQGETAEERDLKDRIRTTSDPRAKRNLERRLSDMQRQRQAENASAQAQVAQANLAAEAEVRERRLAAGSRFNIRWDKTVPPEAMTPEGVMAALAEYVDFSPMDGAAASPPAPGGPGAGVVALQKGMTVEEVEQLLGPAKTVVTDDAAGLEIMTRTYDHPEHKVVAKFASGVLVDFAITPH
jgi:hypothetical protein